MVASYVLSENSIRNEHEVEFTARYIEDFLFLETANALHIIQHRQRL